MSGKVLILANSSSGLYDFRNELISQLMKDYQLVVSVPVESAEKNKISDLQALGCQSVPTPIDRRGINPITDFKLLLKYQSLIRSEKPDLVITYTIKPNIYGGLICRMNKIPYGINVTGLGTTFQKEGILKKLVITMYRMALKKARVVFFENTANRQFFVDEKIVLAEKTVVLNGAGVNLERYDFRSYPQTKPVRFLFVGRVMKEKGVDELFSAMERLRQEGAECMLDVLGGYEEDYADVIHCYEKQGWLRYHGYQIDVRPFIEHSHCFVLPSYHEGMANTNLECAAMGRPLITSNIPGCKEAVIPGKSGLLCEAKDAQSLYDAMRRFLKLTQDERAQMGKAGRAHMEAVFDKRLVVAETVKNLGLTKYCQVLKDAY